MLRCCLTTLRQCALRRVHVPAAATGTTRSTPRGTDRQVHPTFTLALSSSARGVAQYPTPRTGRREQKNKKQFNYLTGERLVRTERTKLTRQAVRNRDDVGLQRRRNFRAEMLRDVEEKIHYLSPEVKQYVFFPRTRAKEVRRLFRGNRVLHIRTFTRIFVGIIDQLTTKENREALVELMKKVGVEPPTAATFQKYSDRKTGKINVPLVHSPWLERYFVELGRKYTIALASPRTADGKLDVNTFPLAPQQAFVLLHFDDESKVPSLADWSHRLGPLNPKTELLEGGHRQQTLSTFLVESRREVLAWGQRQVHGALAPLSVEEQQTLVEKALAEFEPRMEKLSAQLEFAAKVMLAIHSLPEVKAMQTPGKVFATEKALETIIRQHGVAFPSSQHSLKDWRALSQEEQSKYYCFGKKAESRAGSGMQLFARYCTRDYGIARSDIPKLYARLSEEQQAALNFPFYYPITPKNATAAAFKKFYVDMCERYGLVRNSQSLSHGNRLFESAMRQRWRRMPADERLQYYNDSIMAAFPLQPKGTTATPMATEDEEETDRAATRAAVAAAEAERERHADDILTRARQAAHKVAASRSGKKTQKKKVAKSSGHGAGAGGKKRRKKGERLGKDSALGKRGGLFVYSRQTPEKTQATSMPRVASSSEVASLRVPDTGAVTVVVV